MTKRSSTYPQLALATRQAIARRLATVDHAGRLLRDRWPNKESLVSRFGQGTSHAAILRAGFPLKRACLWQWEKNAKVTQPVVMLTRLLNLTGRGKFGRRCGFVDCSVNAVSFPCKQAPLASAIYSQQGHSQHTLEPAGARPKKKIHNDAWQTLPLHLVGGTPWSSAVGSRTEPLPAALSVASWRHLAAHTISAYLQLSCFGASEL